jgi:hypothetical protein
MKDVARMCKIHKTGHKVKSVQKNVWSSGLVIALISVNVYDVASWLHQLSNRRCQASTNGSVNDIFCKTNSF